MSKYRLRTIDQISTRPVLSIGGYVSLDAECIVAGSSDRHLRFLDKDDLNEIAKCRVDKKSVNCVSISQMSPEGDDPIIVTGGKDSSVQIWNPTDGSLEKNIELPTKEVRSLAIYQGTETLIVVGTKEAKVIVWDVTRNSLVRIFEGHKASVHCVSITSSAVEDDQHDLDFLCIASGGADRTVRTWDLVTGKRKKKFRHKRSIAAMVVANKGIRPLLATGGVERAVKLWDVETGVLLRTLEGHLDQINCLALWEGYQMLLISGSSDHTLRVYDILSGECVCVLQGHADSVLGVAVIDYDCPKIVSCSEDLSLVQWSLQDVIADFFCMDAENLGARNIVPPYLPVVEYTAPPELDKRTLTKEERKRLRREQKRAKRKASTSAKGVLTSTSSKDAALRDEEGEGEGDEGDVDDGDEFDPYREDFDEEMAEDSAYHRERLMLAQLQKLQLEEEEERAAKADEVSPATPVAGASNRVAPLDATGGAERGAVAVRKASVVVMKNILGKVMGFGSAAAVGIEPAAGPPRLSTAREDENSLRALANAAQNKFNIAEVEKELSAERARAKAAEKLAFRLNMKKAAGGAAGGGAVGAAGTGPAGRSEELSEAALQALKAEKLKQHKLQEGRRHQSMLVAKERSSSALQKRLDELAARRQLMPASVEEGESSSDDSDKDNGSSKRASKGDPEQKTAPMPQQSEAAAAADGTAVEGGDSGRDRTSSTSSSARRRIVYISDEEEEELSGADN